MEHSAPTAPTLTLPPTWSTDEEGPEPDPGSEPGQVPGPGDAASPRDGEAVPPPSDEDGPGGTPPWGAPPPPPPLPPTPPPPPPPAAGAERRTLRRHSGARVFGGVAAGLADYLDIDVAVVRIAFVVLAFLGGSGILLYVAGWLLIPADDTDRAVAHQWLQPRNRPRSIVVTVLAGVLILVALTNLFSSGPWWPRWDHGVGGLGFFWALLALVLAAGLLVTAGRRRGSLLRWLVVTSLVSLLAVATVAVATVFSVEALSGVPLRGGVGDAQWRPASISQVDQRYRLAMGNMVVDLRAVDFSSGTTHITATVGIGHLLVELPPGPTVDVTAHSGLGDVQLFGQDAGGLGTRRSLQVTGSSAGGATAHIRLDAETGVGQVQVVRSPAWSTAGVPAPTPPPVPLAPS